MWNETGEHDSDLIIWTLCILAFGVILVSTLGG